MSQVGEFLVLEVVDLFVECLGRVGREDAGLLQFVLGLSDRLRVGRVTGYSLVQDALSMEFLPGGQNPHWQVTRVGIRRGIGQGFLLAFSRRPKIKLNAYER